MSTDSFYTPPPPRELPAVLQQGGFFDALLNRPCSGALDDVRILRDRLQSALRVQQIRRSGQPYDGGTDDSVLGVAITTKLSEQVGGELWDRALNDYYINKSNYDIVLGDAIPERLRLQVEKFVASRAYHEGTNHTAADDLPVFLAGLQRQRSRSTTLPGVTTGFPAIDISLGGGLAGLNLLGGGSMAGKTSLAMQIMDDALVADPKLAAVVWTPDILKGDWLCGLLCRRAQTDKATLLSKELGADRMAQISKAQDTLRDDLLGRIRFIDLNTSIKQSFVHSLGTYSSELLHACGADRLLIVIDYLQLVPPEPDATDPDRSRVDQISQLKRIGQNAANPRGATILAISEVTKQSDTTNLRVDDVLGSARIAYGADSIMLLQTANGQHGHGAVVPRSLRIAKARHGMTCPDIRLQFDHRYYRFLEPKDSAAAPSTINPATRIDPFGGSKGRKTK